jgi:hypothetical protein
VIPKWMNMPKRSSANSRCTSSSGLRALAPLSTGGSARASDLPLFPERPSRLLPPPPATAPPVTPRPWRHPAPSCCCRPSRRLQSKSRRSHRRRRRRRRRCRPCRCLPHHANQRLRLRFDRRHQHRRFPAGRRCPACRWRAAVHPRRWHLRSRCCRRPCCHSHHRDPSYNRPALQAAAASRAAGRQSLPTPQRAHHAICARRICPPERTLMGAETRFPGTQSRPERQRRRGKGACPSRRESTSSQKVPRVRRIAGPTQQGAVN